MIPIDYALRLFQHIKESPYVDQKLLNHGYSKTVLPQDGILFKPIDVLDHNKSYIISVTPGGGQNLEQIITDVSKGYLLLVAEAFNTNGDHVILEDHSRYMRLTNHIQNDTITYCQKVINAIIHVTGAAETKGLTVHDHITQLAD